MTQTYACPSLQVTNVQLERTQLVRSHGTQFQECSAAHEYRESTVFRIRRLIHELMQRLADTMHSRRPKQLDGGCQGTPGLICDWHSYQLEWDTDVCHEPVEISFSCILRKQAIIPQEDSHHQ